VAVPTLLVWGEHDTLVPPVVGEALHQSLPNAQFVVLDGTGHVPMWERPEAFNQLVLRFLESTADEPGAVA
jgi:pimeloyl-ACP methyl ester carboxylesterase